jgi:acetyltransferase-like isoleucine patch superfamily enzyme
MILKILLKNTRIINSLLVLFYMLFLRKKIKSLLEKLFDIFCLRYFYFISAFSFNIIINIYGRIRFWSLVRNRGKDCHCHWNAILKESKNIMLGNNVVIGKNVTIGAHNKVILSDNVRLSADVIIETGTLDFYKKFIPYKHSSKPIVLEKNVWIGIRSIVLGGVTIGENSVVGAGSLVTKNVPANTLVAGVPARIIRKTR